MDVAVAQKYAFIFRGCDIALHHNILINRSHKEDIGRFYVNLAANL